MLYNCPQCSRQGMTRRQYTKHMHVHDTRQVICAHCQKAFSNPDSLRVHQRLVCHAIKAFAGCSTASTSKREEPREGQEEPREVQPVVMDPAPPEVAAAAAPIVARETTFMQLGKVVTFHDGEHLCIRCHKVLACMSALVIHMIKEHCTRGDRTDIDVAEHQAMGDVLGFRDVFAATHSEEVAEAGGSNISNVNGACTSRCAYFLE